MTNQAEGPINAALHRFCQHPSRGAVMSGRPWYKRYPSDFIAGTLQLSLEEKGAYSIIIDLMFDRRGPIDDDARWIATVCGCSTRKWNTIKARLIELQKITIADGMIANNRVLEQCQIEEKESLERRSSGAKGGREKILKRRKRAENEPKTSRKSSEKRPVSQENNALDQIQLAYARASPDTRKKERKNSAPPAGAPPTEKPTGSNHGKRKLGARIKADWRPDEKTRLACERIAGQEHTRRALDAFVGYWIDKPGSGALKLAWDRAFLNWIKKDVQRGEHKSGTAGGQRRGGRLTVSQGVAAILGEHDEDRQAVGPGGYHEGPSIEGRRERDP